MLPLLDCVGCFGRKVILFEEFQERGSEECQKNAFSSDLNADCDTYIIAMLSSNLLLSTPSSLSMMFSREWQQQLENRRGTPCLHNRLEGGGRVASYH